MHLYCICEFCCFLIDIVFMMEVLIVTLLVLLASMSKFNGFAEAQCAIEADQPSGCLWMCTDELNGSGKSTCACVPGVLGCGTPNPYCNIPVKRI
jgi:hypothetical protein